MVRRGWRMAYAAGAAALGVGLTACSASQPATSSHAATPTTSQSSHLPPARLLAASVARTESAGSADMSLSMSVSGTPTVGASAGSVPVSLNVDATGAFDFDTKVGELSISLPAPVGTMEMRLVDGTLYLKLPSSLAATVGAPWVSVPESSYESQGGLGSFTSPDPSQFLSGLDQVSDGVTEVGPGTVGGVAAVEYRADIDVSKASQSEGASSAQGQALQQALSQLGLTSVPVDVWVDSAGRLVQLAESLTIFGMHLQLTVDLSHYGVPVVVSPPPADQTTGGSGLLQNGELGKLFGSFTT